MSGVLLSLHVVAGIVLIGPITVAASLFPRFARQCLEPGVTGLRAQGVVLALHRVTRVYAVVALSVPALGLATASSMRVLTQPWLLVAIAVTGLAAVVLALAVLPGQRRILEDLADVDPAEPATAVAARQPLVLGTRRLARATGGFALLWVVVVVLMILRPGSSTGVWA